MPHFAQLLQQCQAARVLRCFQCLMRKYSITQVEAVQTDLILLRICGCDQDLKQQIRVVSFRLKI
jgi:hypothetical protein